MPATYAHHRFGELAFSGLPADVRQTVQRFRQLYDVGQHGPDLFFFHQPLYRTKTVQLGSTFHRMSGREFFGRLCDRLRENATEGDKAYLYGVLGHYALDSVCHPYVCALEKEGKAGHTELETELDRHFLTLDGKEPACTQNLGRHVRLTWGECVTVSRFYPPAGAAAIRRSVVMMRTINRLLAVKNRKFPKLIFSLGGRTGAEMVMHASPNPRCAPYLKPLCGRFDEALARYPALLTQLQACLKDGTPLGTDFEAAFG